MRVRSIDVFRGFSVVLMVFFTLFALLSPYPDFLQHNKPDSVHFGDFVLPMFLFASGMSLVFFAKKREKESKLAYFIDCMDRFTKLFLVSLFIGPITTGSFFGMDVIMLNLLLSIPTLILIAFPEVAIAIISLLVFAAYFILSGMHMLPDFSAQHLGGYPAALFYLPVMLGGVIAGKMILKARSTDSLLAASAMVSMLLFLLIPPYKMVATPSFMALSVLLSLLFFRAIEIWLSRKPESLGFLEYLGRRSIRYWVLMFVLVIIPLDFYALSSHLELPLSIPWEFAFLLCILCLIFLHLMTRGIDFAESIVAKLIQKK